MNRTETPASGRWPTIITSDDRLTLAAFACGCVYTRPKGDDEIRCVERCERHQGRKP